MVEQKVIRFTTEQVTALCGGELPDGFGFDCSRVEHFRIEEEVLQPYAGDDLLPGPGLWFHFTVISDAPEREAASTMDDLVDIPDGDPEF